MTDVHVPVTGGCLCGAVRYESAQPPSEGFYCHCRTCQKFFGGLFAPFVRIPRQSLVFTKGAHRLFRNIAKSMTGVSATTAGSTVVVGIVGVLMIWLGGRAIIAGEMTLGDLVMYIFFIGLVAAPLVSIASIGTQITEAFAGLDRIREILDMRTEVDEDAVRQPIDRLVGEVVFDEVWFEYNAGQPVLRGVSAQIERATAHIPLETLLGSVLPSRS